MLKKIHIIFFLFVFINAEAQIESIGLPVITNYSQITYRAHYQNWGAGQLDNGLMFFANGDGVLTFDGKNWTVTVLPNQETPRDIAITEAGKIYVAGDNLIGYFTVDSVFQLKYFSLLDKIPEKFRDFKTIWDVETCGDTAYARSKKYVFEIVNDNVKVYSTNVNSIDFYISDKNEVFVGCIKKNYTIKEGVMHSYETNDTIICVFEKNDSIFGVSFNAIYNISNDKLTLYSQFETGFLKATIYDVQLYHENYLLISSSSGLYFIDFNGNLCLQLTKDLGLTSTNVYNTFTDNLNNIWVFTSNGISYVEISSPIKLIDERVGLELSHPTFFAFLNKKIHLSTGHKIYQLLRDDNAIFNSEIVTLASGQSWSSIEIGEELYIAHNPNIIRLDKNNNIKEYGNLGNVWMIKQTPFYENDYIVATSKGVYLYTYNGDSLKFQYKMQNFEKDAREIFFDKNDNLWIGVDHDGIYKIELDSIYEISDVQFYNENNGLLSTNTIRFFNWSDTLLISTYKNLFFYDSNIDSIYEYHQISDNFNIKDKRILQLIGIDDADNFWFEYYNDDFDAEVFCFKKKNNKFIETNIFAKRLLNYSLGFVENYDANHTILATTKGFAFINLKLSYNDSVAFAPVLSRILTNDSLLFGGYILNNEGIIVNEFPDKQKLTVEYENNSLQFIYGAPFFIAPDKTKYRVKLDNYENDWSLWTYESKKEYTNLPPGNYTFMIEAENILGYRSEISSFNIRIKYPWYRTIYAYFFYLLILLFFLYGLVRFFTFRLKRRNDKLEELVDQRTNEIRFKNSELEQQKEEILTQSEELVIVNNELEKLSAIVRETDNAVILTDKEGDFIWVNNAFTNIFGYTLEELVTKVSPNIISDQTDDAIKKIVNKCLTDKITVEYELKLKNKAGNDIWIHTTLTPILDDEGEIISLIAIDADITPMKVYERQIKEQSEQITASIRYARAIQESILPTRVEIDNIFDNFIIFKPKDIVSGDFYWISNLFTEINGRLTSVNDKKPTLRVGYTSFFSVVDCTGHGVPGAFMSLISSHLLGEIINEQRFGNPVEILEKLDINLSKALKRSSTKNYDGMVVSLCRLDKVINGNKIQTQVKFAGAKQHITYYKKSTNDFTKIRGSARQIGFVLNPDIKFVEHKFFLEKDDTLFMYSDGLKDLNNLQRDSFGYSRIRKILLENIDKPIEDIGLVLENKMLSWLGNDNQRDDITFIGLRIK